MELPNELLYLFTIIGVITFLVLCYMAILAIIDARRDWLNEKNYNEKKEKNRIKELESEVRDLRKELNYIRSKSIDKHDLIWINKDIDSLKEDIHELKNGKICDIFKTR